MAFVEGSSCHAQKAGIQQLVPPATLRMDMEMLRKGLASVVIRFSC
jgi:hypothetical protein